MNPTFPVFALQELGRGIARLFVCAVISMLLLAAFAGFLSSVVVASRHRRRIGHRVGKRAHAAGVAAGLFSGLFGILFILLLLDRGFSPSPAMIVGYFVLVLLSCLLASRAALEPKRLNVVPLAGLGVALLLGLPGVYYSNLSAHRPPPVDELERRLQRGDGRVVRFVEASDARTLHIALASLDRFSDADRPKLIRAIGLHRAADRRASIVLAGYLDGTRERIGPEDAQSAVLALSNMGSVADDALPALRRFALDDRHSASSRARALQALARMRGSEAQTVPVFIEALRDEHVEVRQSATHHLGGMGPSAVAATDELKMLLKASPKEEQQAILRALARIQSPATDGPHNKDR